MRKIIITLALIFSFGIILTPVNASNCNYYIQYDENGKVVTEHMPQNNVSRAGAHTILTEISNGSQYNIDSGYHPQTNVWRKVSAYNFSTSNSTDITVSFNVGGRKFSGTIGISQTSTQNFGYTITADQNRFSKIRVYTSFDWTYYKAELIDDATGNLLNTYYFTSLYKTHEEFRPVYQ